MRVGEDYLVFDESVCEVSLFFFAKRRGVNHVRNHVEKQASEGVHSKHFQKMFCEKTSRAAERPRFGAERGRGSRKERKLKHHEDRNV